MNYIAHKLRKNGINPVDKLIEIAEDEKTPAALRANIYREFLKMAADTEKYEQMDLFDNVTAEIHELPKQATAA